MSAAIIGCGSREEFAECMRVPQWNDGTTRQRAANGGDKPEKALVCTGIGGSEKIAFLSFIAFFVPPA
jgi:hypothetical protein